MYSSEYTWHSKEINVTSPSIVTDSRSTVTPQVIRVSPSTSQLMLNDDGPLARRSLSTYQKSTNPMDIARTGMNEP